MSDTLFPLHDNEMMPWERDDLNHHENDVPPAPQVERVFPQLPPPDDEIPF